MHWKEILPSDHYIACMNDQLHETDRDILTLLYQPLIGSLAYSLYMTLSSEINRNKGKMIERSHKTLMIFTDKSLDVIFEERKKLEAIGLLNVYRKKREDEIIYYYELHPPLSAKAFFHDDMLSVFLYNRIGSKEQYLQIRNYFKIETIEDKELEVVTRSFDQVFTSVHPSEMTSQHPDMIEALSQDDTLEGRGMDSQYEMKDHQFNYTEFIANMPPFVSKAELQKDSIVRLIKQMAFLYKFTPQEMSKVVQDAMLHTDELDQEELRKQAKRRYRMKEADQPPKLGMRTQPEHLRSQKTPPKTAKEKQILYFETTSPMEYLEELSGGAKVYEGELDMIERLMFEYKLEPGVVNVLLEYITLVNDKKISKPLAFKIASHWSRKKIETVEQAMELAKKEHQKRTDFKQNKTQDPKQSVKKSYSNAVRTEPLPKWMTDENWNKEKESPDELMEAKKKAAEYKEMLRKKKRGEG
ncbi:DnaD domain protein [Bacillus shivajii]|uniref:replication initiation and membrane attachment family protein n=1 Tax=Bacillus shivajii TaxID=1983719 RepID=UPI001CFABB95|nr:DnaD domain protein [Bacillus shivajii]UCZ52243.1 DnaD domain protein [Bacillus shivajii]